MPTRKLRAPLSITLILFLLMGGGLSLAGCQCPPNCPPGPINLTPANWDPWLEEGQYDQIIKEISQVIESGEQAEFYAEARLYRGLAALRSGGSMEDAKADLEIAEKRIDELKTVDAAREQVLLYRGLMVVNVNLGDIQTGEAYRDKAIELAPDQREAIEKEFEDAKP